MEQLLTGLKVVDLSRGLAGALCTMNLADNGADVIKLEPPEGDFLRNQLPHHVWNRNKRSAVCDLKTDAGKALLHKLLADADVLVENFRPGKAAKLGLDAGELRKRYPRLVHLSITGYGTWGPQKDAPGYEPLVQAWLGLQSEQVGWRPGPHYAVLQLGSYGAGIIGTTGTLAALRARDLTGRGQHVETSLYDGVLALQVMIWSWAENDPTQAPFNNPSLGVNVVRRHLMTYGIIAAGDGKYFQMHSGQPGKFFKALDIFGVKDKVDFVEPHLEKSAPLSDKDRHFFETEVPKIIRSKPRAEWIRLFKEADIVALEVDPAGAAAKEPQVVHDRTFIEIDDPVIGKFKCVGPVLTCADAPASVRRPAPRLGEHQKEVESKGWLAAKTTPIPASNANLKHPLQGVKIVDFGNYFAGPYASRMLSDLGADVIKVEPPSGDTLRPTPTAFRAAQRGKRSIALDLKTPEGKAIAQKLVAWADVMTHNMRADTADKLGLGFEEARRLSPKIVYLHSAGFGATGPRAKEGAFAPLVAGLCGLAAQAAGEGNPPVQSISNEDHHSGALGAAWLMMGLNYVARTGKAVKLNTSLLAATLYVTSEIMLKPDDSILFRYSLDKDATGLGPLSRIYKGSDEQWSALVIEQAREWKALTGVAGLEALGKDARFATVESRNANAAALGEVLTAWYAARSAKDAVAALKKAGVPAEVTLPVRVKEHFFDAENFAKGRIAEYPHSTFGRMREGGHVIRFSETPGLIRGPSPLIGEHSLEVFAQFGISEAEARAMRDRKVTTWPDTPASKAA